MSIIWVAISLNAKHISTLKIKHTFLQADETESLSATKKLVQKSVSSFGGYGVFSYFLAKSILLYVYKNF